MNTSMTSKMTMHLLRTLALAMLALGPLSAQAWWNKDWTQRTKLTLDTGAQGANIPGNVAGATLALRLHSGNFDFAAAQENGADLRVLAGDDKTPLKFHVERFDGLNELALLWVQLPTLAGNSDKNQVHVYYGNPKAPAEVAVAFDPATRAVFHFSAPDGADHTGQLKPATAPTAAADAILAGGVRLAGSALTWPAAPATTTAAGAALTWSLWVRPDAAGDATLLQQGPLALKLAGGKAQASLGTANATGGDVAPAAWSHLALTLGGGKLTLYVGGTQVAQVDATAPALDGPLALGAGFTGQADELVLAAEARSADWLRLAAASQGIDNKLVRAQRETADSAGSGGEGGHGGYMGILVANLTVDAWVVIVILGVMFVVAAWVMVSKALLIGRTDKANRAFLADFRNRAGGEMLAIGEAHGAGESSLYRLYRAGTRELGKRDVGKPQAAALSGASLDAVKAAVDADMVRETHRLNAGMVLLTIAISGGPFLGLLGTVVGVMITFAAIAAAGDVNVNAIAPGIAAALLATVAGLGVAIPALFGYNWLASRIKNISADMQIFVDEFITRVAEQYGAR